MTNPYPSRRCPPRHSPRTSYRLHITIMTMIVSTMSMRAGRTAPIRAKPLPCGGAIKRRIRASSQKPETDLEDKDTVDKEGGAQLLQNAADSLGVSLGASCKFRLPRTQPVVPTPWTGPQLTLMSPLASPAGPIGLTIGSDLDEGTGFDASAGSVNESISTMSTAEWREKYEQDGTVDLWVKEEFNAASRLVGGRAVHFGGEAGQFSGEGHGESTAKRHKVKIYNKFIDQEVDVEVPEDRYILWEAEDQGLMLPYACRMGCCTACAVRVKEGEMYQPEGLGISNELKKKGFAMMCIGFPRSDLVLETVEEDEVYELQFGEQFDQNATNPNGNRIERDDFAIELALLDE